MMTDYNETAIVTPETTIVRNLESIVTAETDVQVSTAKRYPRSIALALKNSISLATINEEMAASCMYALPRAGKNITGPSIRLAEVMASEWGNLRIAARIIDQTDTFIVAQGLCWDMEKNVQLSTEVRRRITDKHGAKFNEDMINVTAMAALAIARRNAIFQVIPRALMEQVYAECRRVAVGTVATLTAKRDKLLDSFQKIGVPKPMILEKLNLQGVEDINLTHLEVLLGLASAIKNGETTIEDAFAPDDSEDTQEETRSAATASTAQRAKKNMKKATAPAETPSAAQEEASSTTAETAEGQKDMFEQP